MAKIYCKKNNKKNIHSLKGKVLVKKYWNRNITTRDSLDYYTASNLKNLKLVKTKPW